jgi:Icc-related predicted phosphoesterase
LNERTAGYALSGHLLIISRIRHNIMASNTVKTRILVLSDTHNALPEEDDDTLPYRWPLPQADVLIHAGDLTGRGTIKEHEFALELLEKVNAELKIVIPGNHDMTLHRQYCHGDPNIWCPEYSDEELTQIEQMYTNEEAQAKGIVYMVEGTRSFTLKNGAKFTVYANAWQPEFLNWGFNYPRSQDRFNVSDASAEFQAPHPVPDEGVDIMVTHGPPMGILDKVASDGKAVGCEHLRRAVERCKPQLHVFGHIHESWGGVKKSWADGKERELNVPREEQVEKMGAFHDGTELKVGEETVFINASIMTLQYDPDQAPWVVDLMLKQTD